jgi:hypothetical protein
LEVIAGDVAELVDVAGRDRTTAAVFVVLKKPSKLDVAGDGLIDRHRGSVMMLDFPS